MMSRILYLVARKISFKCVINVPTHNIGIFFNAPTPKSVLYA